MNDTNAVDRDWIAAELLKIADAERALATEAKARAATPPTPELGVVYHEIAEREDGHALVAETVAARYGGTPTRFAGTGVGETLGRLKDKVVALGAGPIDVLRRDLAARADAVEWIKVWTRTLEDVGDVESGRALAAVSAAHETHRDALEEGLRRLVGRRAAGGTDAAEAVTPAVDPEIKRATAKSGRSGRRGRPA